MAGPGSVPSSGQARLALGPCRPAGTDGFAEDLTHCNARESLLFHDPLCADHLDGDGFGELRFDFVPPG